MPNDIYGYKELKALLLEVISNDQPGEERCPKAEEFISWISGYSIFCVPEEKDNWNEIIQRKIYEVGLMPDLRSKGFEIETKLDMIIDNIYCFIDAGRIMNIYETTKSWEEVTKFVCQIYSGWEYRNIIYILLQFAHFGPEYVDRYFFLEKDKKLQTMYDYAKTRNENRKNLEQELVKALTYRLELKKKQQ